MKMKKKNEGWEVENEEVVVPLVAEGVDVCTTHGVVEVASGLGTQLRSATAINSEMLPFFIETICFFG